MVRGNVQPGETVYVHAGACGISIATIAVALELEAIPYVGVFNREQKVYLKSRFPQVCTRREHKPSIDLELYPNNNNCELNDNDNTNDNNNVYCS